MHRGASRRSRLSYLWAAPVSAVGLLLSALALHRGGAVVVDGVLEVHGPLLRWALRTLVPIPGGAAAITFGHVVLGTDRGALDATRAHERVHVRQYERWGPLFPALYLLAGAWAFARGGDVYRDNTFERDARAVLAGRGCRADLKARRYDDGTGRT